MHKQSPFLFVLPQSLKRVLALCFVFIFALAACGEQKEDDKDFEAPSQPDVRLASNAGAIDGVKTVSCWPQGEENLACDLENINTVPTDQLTVASGETLTVVIEGADAPSSVTVVSRELDSEGAPLVNVTLTESNQVDLSALSDGEHFLEITTYYDDLNGTDAAVTTLFALNVGQAVATEPTATPAEVEATPDETEEVATTEPTEELPTTDAVAESTNSAATAMAIVTGIAETATAGAEVETTPDETEVVDGTPEATEELTGTEVEGTEEATAEATEETDETPEATEELVGTEVEGTEEATGEATEIVEDTPVATEETGETPVASEEPTEIVEDTPVATEETGETPVASEEPTEIVEETPVSTEVVTTPVASEPVEATPTNTAVVLPSLTPSVTPTIIPSDTPVPTNTTVPTTIAPSITPTPSETEQALTLRVSGISYLPVGMTTCTLDADGEETCEEEANPSAVRVQSQIGSAVTVVYDGERPSRMEYAFLNRQFQPITMGTRGRSNAYLFNVDVPSAGLYILSIKLYWEEQTITYFYQIYVRG